MTTRYAYFIDGPLNGKCQPVANHPMKILAQPILPITCFDESATPFHELGSKIEYSLEFPIHGNSAIYRQVKP